MKLVELSPRYHEGGINNILDIRHKEKPVGSIYVGFSWSEGSIVFDLLIVMDNGEEYRIYTRGGDLGDTLDKLLLHFEMIQREGIDATKG